MSAKKKVEALLEKYSVDELLDNPEIDMTPFIEFALEGLGATGEDDLDDYLDAVQDAMDDLEIEEDDRELMWNRAALLKFANILPEGSFEGLEELYGGAEGSMLSLSCMAFIDILNDRDDADAELVVRMHLFTRDLLELSWEFNGDINFATEMLWQAESACSVLTDSEDWEEIRKIAKKALKKAKAIEGDAEGLREVIGLLNYFRGEGEDDDDKAEEYYEKALELLDVPEITDDPVGDETLDIISDLKEEE